MRIRILVAVAVLLVLGVFGTPDAPAQGSGDTIVSSAAAGVATDVINGTVLAIQSVDTGSEVHSLALVRVDDALEGDLSGDVFVEVPGGMSTGGLNVVVSHQPSFRVSDVVQLALLRATAAEEAALTGGASPVYSVVGGIDGAAAVSGSLVSQANAAGDFTLTGSKWNPNDSSRWPIPYRINTANSGLSASDTVAALQGGFQQWVDDNGTDIEFNYQGTTSGSPSNYNDGTNTVGWVTTGAADQFLAQAVWVSSSGTTLGFDIRFNRDYLWAYGAEPGRFDVETVQLHEVGHALGLGHTTASTAEVMYPSISSNRTKGLGDGDLSGVAGLYPAANPPAPPPPSGAGDGVCNGLAVTIDMNTNGGDGYGTEGRDVIMGTSGADIIYARGGDDVICSGGGDDNIHAGAGNDVVAGGDGVDRVWGGDGDDELHGGNDRDIMIGEAGQDTIYGGAGRDSLFGGDDADVIDGGQDTDLIRGGGGADTLRTGSSGNDRIVGDGGNDRIDASATSGSTRLIGGDGHDVIVGSNQLDRIWGSAGNDNIRGGGYSDLIRGGDGDDKAYGENGKDTIDGGNGADTLIGGLDPDKLVGMAGHDTCDGGPGAGDVAHSTCELTPQVP